MIGDVTLAGVAVGMALVVVAYAALTVWFWWHQEPPQDPREPLCFGGGR